MRQETKIGILLIAISLNLRHFFASTYFLQGLFISLSLVLLLLGYLPEKNYDKMKARQYEKIHFLRRIFGLNR